MAGEFRMETNLPATRYVLNLAATNEVLSVLETFGDDCSSVCKTMRDDLRAAGCMAVTVCGIGIAACVLLGLLLAGPCRRDPQPGPESLAANIAAGIYGDELAGCGGH